MDLGSIFLILALAVVVFLFISRPFLERRSEGERLLARQAIREKDRQRSSLLAQRDRLLNAIQELDTDSDLGKIPEDAYAEQRESLLKAGTMVFRQLDELTKSTSNAPDHGKTISDERDDLEALIASRRRAREKTRDNYCHSCGNALHHGDKFCPGCGTRIENTI